MIDIHYVEEDYLFDNIDDAFKAHPKGAFVQVVIFHDHLAKCRALDLLEEAFKMINDSSNKSHSEGDNE